MLKSLKSRHFAEPSRILPQQRIDAVGMPLPADTLATANDDDVYIPDTILWDLAGGNSPHRPLFETVSATASATKAKTDDGDDLPDMIILDIDAGNVASERQGGLPDIIVRDDYDDSAPGDDDNHLPDLIVADIVGDGVVDFRQDEMADQFMFEKIDDEILPNQDNEIVGTIENDLLIGTEESELLRGYQGADILSGMGGDDEILGGTGNDTLFGGEGNDRLAGMAGDDVVFGDGGDDVLRAGIGNDQLSGGDGADEFLFYANIGHVTGLATIKDFEIGIDSFGFGHSFLDIAPDETWQHNVIALEGTGGAELWADVAGAGLTQIAFVENLTAAELQQELMGADWLG